MSPAEGRTFYSLKVENARAEPLTVTVLTIEEPNIASRRYSISGEVRYDGIEGTGYLEMWNYFPGGGQYFSRTLDDRGPMMKLTGTSPWRPFGLPFDATGAPPPTRLVVNVVLPGRGTAYLGPLRLAEIDRAGSLGTGDTTVDRLERLAGVAGVVVGTAGALIGILTSAGRARRVVIGITFALTGVGIALFVAGIMAARTQPLTAGPYPLLLLGFLMSVLPVALLPRIRKRYEEIELRTIRAHDVG